MEVHFSATQDDMAPEAVEAHAPGVALVNVKQAGEFRFGTRAAPVKLAGEQTMPGIRGVEQLLKIIGGRAHQAGFQGPQAARRKAPMVEPDSKIHVGGSASTRDAPAGDPQLRPRIGDVALDRIPAQIAIARALAPGVAGEGRSNERAEDAPAPGDVAGDLLGGRDRAGGVAANRGEEIVPGREVAKFRGCFERRIFHAQRTAGHNVRAGRIDFCGIDEDLAFVFHEMISKTARYRNLARGEMLREQPLRRPRRFDMLEILAPAGDLFAADGSVPMEPAQRKIVVVNGGENLREAHKLSLSFRAELQALKRYGHAALDRAAERLRVKVGDFRAVIIQAVVAGAGESPGVEPNVRENDVLRGVMPRGTQAARGESAFAGEIRAALRGPRLAQDFANVCEVQAAAIAESPGGAGKARERGAGIHFGMRQAPMELLDGEGVLFESEFHGKVGRKREVTARDKNHLLPGQLAGKN